MKRIIKLIAIILIVGIVFLFAAKNILAKTIISGGVKAITGLSLNIKSMRIGLLNSLIDIKNLKLFNPKGFEDKLMINMPEIFVDYELGEFLKGKIHFTEIRLNLEEFTVVKNKDGVLNLDSLNVVKAKKQTTAKKDSKKKKLPPLKIDVLKLRIGKVIYKDYSKGGKPKVKEYDVDINEQYKNIDDPYRFVSLIVFKALMNTSIARLTNFNLGPLSDGLEGTLKGATGITLDVADKTLETTEQAAKKTGETVKKAGEAAKDAVQKTEEKLKKLLPFGGKE